MYIPSTSQKILFIFIGILIIAVAGAVTFFHKPLPSSARVITATPTGKISILPSVTAFPTLDEKQLHALSVKCTLPNGNGSVIFIKQGNVKAIFQNTNNTTTINNLLFKNATLYTWNDTTHEGSETNLQNNPFLLNAKNNLFQRLLQQKNNCRETILSDDLFSIPSDITFKQSLIPQIPNFQQMNP